MNTPAEQEFVPVIGAGETPLTDKQPANQNNPGAMPPDGAGINVTPAEFLNAIFGERASDAWVCSTTMSSPDWTGGRIKRGSIGPEIDRDQYFCIGLLGPEATRRASDNVIQHYVVFADDVGTKVDPQKWEDLFALGFPTPTAVIETSPGNFTYVWRISRPVPRDDEDRVKALRAVRAALGNLGLSDPLPDDARYIRLPWGVNSKPKYKDAAGNSPRVKLVGWEPENRLDLEQAATILLGSDWKDKADQMGITGTSFAGALHRTADMNNPEPIIQLAQELGLNPVQIRPGVVEAICPNAANHSDRVDTGFAFLGNGLMECNHGHCQGLRTPDFTRLICESYDTRQEIALALGQTPQGPETAGEFLAARAFEYHDNNSGQSAEQLDEEAGLMAARGAAHDEAKKKRLQDALSDLDEKYALVLTINGVVDRSPANGTLFGVMGSQHFTTYHNGMLPVPNGHGRPQGLGSHWLGRPETPRYKDLGLWPVGQEPAGTLNLFAGLPAVSGRTTHRALAAGVAWSCNLALAFIRDVICSGDAALNEYVLNWLAWVVQNPLDKPGVNLVLIGQQGTGKSTLGRMLLDIFGTRYSLHVQQADHLLGRFSGHLEGVLFVLIDEALFGKDPKDGGVYKARTTEPTLLVEHKGQTPRTVRNHMALMILSNALAAAPVETHDRRATVIDVSNARRQDKAYFAALWNEWDTLDGRGALIAFLLARDLTGFDPGKPYATAAKAAMAAATADPVTEWWLELLQDGGIQGALPDANGKDADWSAGPVTVPNDVLTENFENWCRDKRLRHRVSSAEMGRRVGELCPSRAHVKPRRGGKQVRAYAYPDLSVVIAEANAALGGSVLDAEDGGA